MKNLSRKAGLLPETIKKHIFATLTLQNWNVWWDSFCEIVIFEFYNVVYFIDELLSPGIFFYRKEPI